MRLICAWCQKNLSDEEPSDNSTQISYGICPTCRARFFPDAIGIPPEPEREVRRPLMKSVALTRMEPDP